MFIKIGYYNVDIKVKSESGRTCTKEFLNYLAIAFGEAARRYEDLGAHALSKQVDRNQSEIHNYLDARGYYDDVK